MINWWLWDLEIYPNLFLCNGKNVKTGQRVSFQVSQFRDDRHEMLMWLRNNVEAMIGFNNLFYDYPMLHYALGVCWNMRGRDFCKMMYNHNYAKIVKNKKTFIKESDYVKRQIDLFKINHFDNKAKMTSLKLLEFNLMMQNIQELPFPPGTILTEHEIKIVADYCHNDVDATEEVFKETLPEIELREKLSPQYNIDFTNFNSTKMGEWILISKVINALGEQAVYNFIETDYGVKKVIKNTKRDKIDLNEVIFDYIDFTTEPFQRMLKWFKSRVITETKGVFSEIPFEELEILEPYYCIIKKKGKQKTLNVVYKGFQYDFGVGGIHGSVDPGIYEADDNYELWDWDVASYYPNLAIKNKFFPAHFGEVFCDIYEGIYNERGLYPKKTFPMENLALKLALNGSYGKSNSAFSALYDPMYTMKTTVNGQLLLCMLSERLMEEIPDIKMIQINTDGLTVKVHKKYVEQMKSICKRWENLTQLELENVKYSKMIIKDVNNYIAVKEEGGVKRKGAAFIHKKAPGELELHKNFSMLVVPKALEEYFINGTDPEQYIKNHDNIHDFFKRTKINKSDILHYRVYDENNEVSISDEVQRVTRYYVSGTQDYSKETKKYSNIGPGRTLMKEMPPLNVKISKKLITEYNKAVEEEDYEGTIDDYRELRKAPRFTNIEAGYLCTVCNDLSQTTFKTIRDNINYQYYIDEVYKVINLIENKNG